MGIDYSIDLGCKPKEVFSIGAIVARIKGRDRAKAIIQLYRDQGDQRSPTQMGFEMVRRAADGTEEKEIVIVQTLLDAAEELTAWESHCTDCPANCAGIPFGCIGTINYPISAQAERWLLDQLPGNTHPLPFMLLQKAIREMGYTGESVAALRTQENIFFEDEHAPVSNTEGLQVSGNQVFEMLFLSGHILPAHGSMLLQFFGGISPDLDADVIMQLASPPSQDWIDTHIPFLHAPARGDDVSITALKDFLRALYIAYRLGVPVLLDV